MNKCEALNCNYYRHTECEDPVDYVNKDTGVPCCRYDRGAMKVPKLKSIKEDTKRSE